MLFIILPDFMEIVFIQLPYKAGKVAVLEVLRKNRLGKLFVLFAQSVIAIANDLSTGYVLPGQQNCLPRFPSGRRTRMMDLPAFFT